MNIKNKKELGNAGEEIATEYLKKCKYKILERNYYCKQGEVDIIAKDKNEIVFIEVKTRTSNEFGTPAESVNKIKEKHIYQVSRYFLYRRHLIEFDTRIDVIEILLHNGKFNINHIKQVL